MARSAGISGLAVALGAAGWYLAYAGVKDVDPITGVGELLHGKIPTPRNPVVTKVSFSGAATGGNGGGGAATGGAPSSVAAALVAEATRQLGKPYSWGAVGPNAFDCSGLVVWCLRHAGIDVPRLVTTQFMLWQGARTIPWADQQPGDLACWVGHIGICTGNGQMIHAPTFGQDVKRGAIWRQPSPIIRRVTATKAA